MVFKKILRCLVFYNNSWTMDFCTTTSISTSGDSATVHCDCSVDGYLAVGLVTASDNEIVYVEEIHFFEENVRFKIEEDYDAFVKGNESEFEDAIKEQLIDLLQCDALSVRDLTISPGK